jgi:hypothetical protein
LDKSKIQANKTEIENSRGFKDKFGSMIKKEFGKGTLYGFSKVELVLPFESSEIIENPLNQKIQYNYLEKPLIFQHILTKLEIELGLIEQPLEAKIHFEVFCEELINYSLLSDQDLEIMQRQYTQLKAAKKSLFTRSFYGVLRNPQKRQSLYGFKPIFY